MLALDLLMRWFHVGGAIFMLGGSMFIRFVLIPALSTVERVEDIQEKIITIWRRFIGILTLLLLISGFYNYIVVAIPKHRGDGLYHGLMGLKIILALGVFFLASALTGRAKAFEPLRQKKKQWLSITILLAFAVVCIAGYLKLRGVIPTE